MLCSVLSINVLAQCYSHEPILEADNRYQRILDTINSANASVICLQELVHNNHVLVQQQYSIVYAQRPAGKLDGLAILVDTAQCTLLDHIHYQLPYSDRIAIIALVQHTQLDVKFTVTNVHLTYPHHCLDQALRHKQAKHLISQTKLFYQNRNIDMDNVPAIIAGDFNGCHDKVGSVLLEAGFVSSYSASPSDTVITHKTHSGKYVCADYQWISPNASLQLDSWTLLPRDLPHHEWPESYSMSDHRPLLCEYVLLSKL